MKHDGDDAFIRFSQTELRQISPDADFHTWQVNHVVIFP